MDFTTVRENAERGYGRVLSPVQRGMRTGLMQRHIGATALSIGLSLDLRNARLALASEVFEKEVLTFSRLSNDELQALSSWVGHCEAELAEWLAEKYGATERLPGT